MHTMIRTKRIDSTTTAVYGPRNYASRTPIAGWVHTGPAGFVGQLALGCNPDRNTRIFTDMADAVQWVYNGEPSLVGPAIPAPAHPYMPDGAGAV
jgi:hypothetical protein